MILLCHILPVNLDLQVTTTVKNYPIKPKYKWTYLKTWFYLDWKLFETLQNNFKPLTQVDNFKKVLSFVYHYIISKKFCLTVYCCVKKYVKIVYKMLKKGISQVLLTCIIILFQMSLKVGMLYYIKEILFDSILLRKKIC